ncbi:ArsR family transcriptional regulator [Enemella dayhoffiae]|uniref:ArsR family transcriptional regulator n=1 Tax=Enemella dayhoffiae TaxID=2016507 RepID=A0A255GZ19_9ACTN|nr:helix-turn-helix domain-containing protein [Enemella dayhoffiae]OYO20925.1 ArsR family transcriptional regulator [Enemella dayhoffiae]
MSDDLTDRVAALEAAMARLEAGLGSNHSGTPLPPAQAGEFWALEGLEQRHPEGAVLLAGSVEVPEAGPVRWQYGLAQASLLDLDWAELAAALDALGHPVRLTLLQLVLSGVRSTAALAARDELGTTGQLHHHLRVLLGAGWLSSTSRGHYEIPASRVVPLLAILLAARPT